METLKYDSFNPSEFENFQGSNEIAKREKFMLIIFGALVSIGLALLIRKEIQRLKNKEVLKE
jgi:hypothetical protein